MKETVTDSPEPRETEEAVLQTVLPLLKEYTEQLLEECGRYVKAEQTLPTWAFVLANAITSAAILAIMDRATTFTGRTTQAFFFACAFITGFIFLMTLIHRRINLESVHLAERLLIMRAMRLEAIVRTASQLEDHSTIGLALSIELQTRLRSAEQALSFSRIVRGTIVEFTNEPPRPPRLPVIPLSRIPGRSSGGRHYT